MSNKYNIKMNLESIKSIIMSKVWTYFTPILPNPKSPPNMVPTAISGELNADLTSQIETQLAMYKSVKRPPKECDIFNWWKENSKQFPNLADLARIFLCVPATSVSSERLFSRAGIIYSDTLRNRYV
jgi:hypothetical protein